MSQRPLSPQKPQEIHDLAAVLGEDDRLERSFAQRPGNPYRRRKAA